MSSYRPRESLITRYTSNQALFQEKHYFQMATISPELVAEEHSDVMRQTKDSTRYLIILLMCSIGWTFLAYPIARSNYFERVSRRMFWHAMQYHLDMVGQPCDIVIFGDSTGLSGIDPTIVRQQTGMRTCVLSMPYMALSTTGTFVLDHFLTHSPAPRLIVFANHVRHLHAPLLDEDPGVIDGWLLIDRMRPPLQAARFFLRHPRYSVIFMEGVWQQIFTLSRVNMVDLTQRTYWRDMEILRAHSGFFPIQVLESPEVVCGMKMDLPADDPSYLPSLRARYENAATKVLMYVSPVRSCDSNITAYMALAMRMHLRPPAVYKPVDFADAWHLSPTGARRNSVEFAQAVQSRLENHRAVVEPVVH
jgi:hypothetical protein